MAYLLLSIAAVMFLGGVMKLRGVREPHGTPWSSLFVWAILFASGLALWIVSTRADGQKLSASGSSALSDSVKKDYRTVRDYFVRAAEKMPEADYAFKPTPEVRSFGQQVAHVADDQYNLCAPAKGETRKASYTEIETTVSGKANLVAALKKAFEYCDGVYDVLTDASGPEMAVPDRGGRTKFAMLNWNLWHTWEHYGNVVVYLRLKGLVPPSSEPSR